MARNGSGTYSLPAGNPVVTGTTIQSTWANTTLSDIATALTQSLSQDGQTPVTANLPMGGFKLTGLAAGTTAGDSVRYEQFASPPAIGGTAAAAGTFTTLTGNAVVATTLTVGGVSEIPFPSGTRIPFNQTAAPTGWTKDTTAALNDTAMRIVTGVVGSGGTNAFSSAAYTPTITPAAGTLAVSSYTLTIADMPAHTHVQHFNGAVTGDNSSGGGNPPYNTIQAAGSITNTAEITASTGGGGGHSHGLTGAPTATSSTITLSLKYNDFIIASKN